MDIVQNDYAGVQGLHLAGRFDELAAPEVERSLSAVVREDAGRYVLDLSGVEYVSSSGLRVLLMFSRAVKNRQGDLKLAGLTPFVAEVFEVSNFTSVFSVYPTMADALRAFES